MNSQPSSKANDPGREINLNFDCVIAGAGPAASACALVLRQAGLTVCLVSPQSPSSEFSVGESLPGAAIPLLNRIGIEALTDLLTEQKVSSCTGNASAWGSEQWHKMDAIQNPQGGGWHIDRTEFDCALRRQAALMGATWLKGKITSAEYQSHWQLKLDESREVITCRYLVDATGRSSTLSRLLGIRKKHLDQQIATVAWFESTEQDKEQVTRIKAVSDGWWYSARLPNRTPRNLPVRVIAKFALPSDSKQSNQANRFLTMLNASKLLPVQFTEQQLLAPIQLKDASVSQLEQYSDENRAFLAAGDAVLSFDPLSSQGMFFALYSGVKAAETLLMNNGETQADFSAYNADIDSVFQANQKSRRLYYASEYRFAESLFWTSRVL